MKSSPPLMKVPPHNLEAEIAILGAMLIRKQSIPKVQKIINPDDFYREAHKDICKAIFDLKSKADIITVAEWLDKKNLLEKCKGSAYLISIVEAVVTSAGVEYHAEIVKSLSKRRQIISQCSITAEKSFQSWADIEEILSDHKAGIRSIQAGEQGDYRNNQEIVKAVFKDIQERSDSGNRFVGVKTGFQNIDTYMNGLEPKTTNHLIARPSMGKTALALNITDFVASNYPGKAIFFSLESGDKALTRRRLSAHSGVFMSRLRTGDVLDSQWPDLIEAANVLSENNLIIIDRPRYKIIENLIAMAETIAMESPLSLIVIDHIQRMRSRGRFNNRHLELSFISEEISSLANDLNIPILILCQLNREVEKRKDQRPKLFDMKESGDLEQNADVVIGLYREDKQSETMEIECLKGRDTGTWKTYLTFDRFIQKISDYKDPEKYEPPGERIPQRGYDG